MTGEYPPHIQNFFDNLSEINYLPSIHTVIAGTTPGRKRQVQILNKSAIVLYTACWEYYIEDLIREAFNFLLINSKKHNAFPNSVLAKASKEIKNDKDDLRVWDLAGFGWKKVLENYQKTILEKKIDHFHVPRPENIDELYSKLLGINTITNQWSWKKMCNKDAIDTLNKYVDLRGEIVHNVKTKTSVRKKDVDYYRKFLNRTAVILHNRVTTHIENLIGEAPWSIYRYRTVL